jgi:hypothetical protein
VHEQCDEPFPDPAPPAPDVNAGPDGTPEFASWAEIDCQADWPLCDADTVCPDQEPCRQGVQGGAGVCTSADVDLSCDGEGEVMGFGEGACWVCSPVRAHAAACCESLPGFDCRPWPYEDPGEPGIVCAGHDDCEAGLVCGTPNGQGYGICMCPEVVGQGVDPAGWCFG